MVKNEEQKSVGTNNISKNWENSEKMINQYKAAVSLVKTK